MTPHSPSGGTPFVLISRRAQAEKLSRGTEDGQTHRARIQPLLTLYFPVLSRMPSTEYLMSE